MSYQNPRFAAQQAAGSPHNIQPPLNDITTHTTASSESFGVYVFNRSVMERMLPRDVYKNSIAAMEGREAIKHEYADTIAMAMKEWAMKLGATHYSHWFQPLTGATAEKHDAFIDWTTTDQVIEKFSGKQLIQGEPDASSFPSGGLRSTYEARGYTGWDPTSPAFVWSGGDGMTLCIPSVFFSWTGDVLDLKIPLLRSERAIGAAAMRLLKLTGIQANFVSSTLGCEQEYFVIDRSWRNLRPDLIMAGRTVFGASAPKGQELQDHYFGAVKNRILSYMRDFEVEALKLGIPVKTRHNEVAPAQHEIAPVFERSSIGIDHNILLMELMRQKAVNHGLSCLLHEKPFHGINGSGKHCNWSLSTDTGINLLDPTDTPENNIHFLILLTAILDAVHDHSALLRASVASASNDFRLGGHEAPPAIISAYLGGELESILENIEEKGFHTRTLEKIGYDLGVQTPGLNRDTTDRNRTSPFAFTGNKFEFRAVGSSANPSFPITVLNTIVAESLTKILNEIEGLLGDKPANKKNLADAVVPVIRKTLRNSRNIRFGGDGYSDDWNAEARKRKLPVVEKSIDAFKAIKEPSTIRAFHGILTKSELESRYDILAETYAHTLNIEAKLMIDIFQTQILPACICAQKDLAKSLSIVADLLGPKTPQKRQRSLLKTISEAIELAIEAAEDLEAERKRAEGIVGLEARGRAFCNKVQPKGEKLRAIVDGLESHIDDTLWPLPKYRELLFLV